MKDEIVKETVQQSGTIAQRLFGPTADVIGAWMAQPLKERFARNQLERMLSLASKCENMRLPLRMLNLKTIYPYLEGIAIEEEPELQELWDNLMANYLDPDKHLHEESFPHVLKQLSTRDIRVLKFAYESGQVFYTYTSRFEIQLNGQSYETLVEDDLVNVERLGLVSEPPLSSITQIIDDGPSEPRKQDSREPHIEYILTKFGRKFYESCQRLK